MWDRSRGRQGHTWTEQRVRAFRNDHRVVVYREGERAERGEATLEESANRLGVSKMTVVRLGDGLVPVASALGRHKDRARALEFPADRQWVPVRRGISIC